MVKEMRIMKFFGLLIALAIAATWAAAPTPAAAQGRNLLANPSFEGAYSAYVPNPPIDACPVGVCGTAQMPAGWTPWWVPQQPTDPAWYNRMPEWKPAEAPFLNRVRSGAVAAQYFTFHGTHTAGMYQRVNVTPGARLTYTVWGQAWSSATDVDYSDFPTPVNMRIGIDPTGGTNPFGPAVVWSAMANPYDAYQLFSVETAARGDQATVFMYSQPVEARAHNDIYWDDASLTQAVLATATPTRVPATATPTNPPATAVPTRVPATATATSVPATATPNLPTPTPLPTGPWFTATQEPTAVPATPEPAAPAPVEVTGGASAAPVVIVAQAGQPTATPDADGVIYAEVQAGQSFWNVAALNGLTVEELLTLNNLTESDFVQVGQRLIVGYAATATPEPTVAPTEAAAEATSEGEAATATPEAPTATPEPQGGDICLMAFDDGNENGVRDDGEALRAGVAFTILKDEAVVSNYLSDGVAEPYCITGLEAGSYRVTRSKLDNEALTTDGNWAISLVDGSSATLSFGSVIGIVEEEPEVDSPVAAVATDAPAAEVAPTDVPAVADSAQEAGGINTTVLAAVAAVVALLLLVGIVALVISRR